MKVMGKVLVTGGAGFIGSHLIEALHKKGHFIIIIDNLSSGFIKNLKFLIDKKNWPKVKNLNRSSSIGKYRLAEKLIFYKGSITNYSLLEKIFQENENLDFCFHLAAVVSAPWSIKHRKETFTTNFQATKKLVSLGKKYELKGVAFAGSAAEYGNEKRLPIKEKYAQKGSQLSPYGESKFLSTKFISLQNNKNFSAFSLRFFNVYGPRQNPASPYSGVISKFMERVVKKRNIVIYGTGKQTRDFVFVKDVVLALLATWRKKPKKAIFNVGTGEKTTINALANEINQLGGKNSEIVYQIKRQGDILHSQADITKAGKFLSWRPQTNLKKGLKKTYLWYRNYHTFPHPQVKHGKTI